MGFFGFTVQPSKEGKPQPPQPRHFAVVDIDEAHEAVADILTVWRDVAQWPDAPPFPGGVWTDWPRRLARGLAVLKAEMGAVVAYLQHMEAPRG